MEFTADDIREITVQEAVEAFLAIAVAGVSTGFIGARIAGVQAVLPLSTIFYGILPVSMIMIGFLTYKVAMMVYESHEMQSMQMLPAVLMSLVLAVAAVNIGFVTIASGSGLLSGTLGTLRVSFLIVILSMALSISVLTRNLHGTDI